jgi:Fe-S cluster assembly protein SufD
MHTAIFFHFGHHSAGQFEIRGEASAGSELSNVALTFVLEDGAQLDVLHSALSTEAAQSFQAKAALGPNTALRFTAASLGSRMQRLAFEADLNGPGASLDLRGAAVTGGALRCHRHVRIRHRAPDCVSRQLFKTVVLQSGRSSVDGTVTVDSGAQRTDAKQIIHHLMLSKDGRADSKPRLLIHADDVKCSHGAAVGKLDPEQQFYLRARGLDLNAANRLLTEAFLSEALNPCALAEAREAARAILLGALAEAA